MSQSFEVPQVRPDKFTSPEGAIQPKPRSVQRGSDDVSFDSVLHHRAHDMCVVMLHAHLRNIRYRKGILGREIIRMKVIGDGLWFNIEEFLKMLNSFLEGGESFEILKVSDVMTDKGVILASQAKGVF